ncbi:hypothetical protein [Flavobacterium sp.]|uniref:hypothetical protein n=1 Tax=Flavobacterium sp. TaxID=239 RepID=UPI002FDA16BD
MKKNTFLIVVILIFCCSVKGNAQQNNIKFENAVNDQFGTLLESLLKDGKIDELGAKTYLETVFGNDESVTNYLQTIDLSKKIDGLKQGNLSFDSYLSNINSSLISFIPEEKKQAFMNYFETRMIVEGSMNELLSGEIGSNTVNLAAGLIEGSKEAKAERLKKEAIAKKLEVITPTLSKLNNTRAYTKLKIVDEIDSNKNWIVNTNPVVTEDATAKYTTNYSNLENGYLKISTENYVQAVFNWDKMMFFKPMRIYKNPEKFDFSKDFKMNLFLKKERKVAETITIEIGKGYQLSIIRQEGYIYFMTPLNYTVTDKYGELRADNKKEKSDKTKLVDKEKGVILSKNGYGNTFYIRENKNKDIDFDGVLKITIIKKGNSFICKFNDMEYELISEINYFPDKYYLGIVVSDMSKKSYIEIHKLELEHL